MQNSRSLLLAVSVVAVLGLVWCAQHRAKDASDADESPSAQAREPESTSAAANARGDSTVAPATSASVAARSQAVPNGSTKDADGGAQPLDAGSRATLSPASSPSGGSAAVINDALGSRQQSTLQFLSNIERELGREPPPQARELAAMKERGATTADLERYIEREFPKDIQLRALALRWVRGTGGPKAPGTEPGSGDAGPHIAPIRKAP